MIRLIREAELVSKILEIIEAGWFDAAQFGGSGRGGALIESLLGIDANNISAPDTVEWEIKTKLDKGSLVTLFHKDPTRVPGAMLALVGGFGWNPTGKKEYPPGTLSFRHTIRGNSARGFKLHIGDKTVTLCFNADAVAISHSDWLKEVKSRGGRLDPAPFWTRDELIREASRKIANLLFVQGERDGNRIRFLSADLLRGFQPSVFIDYLRDGKIAVDFDARTQGDGLRNHGTKFRIGYRDLSSLYEITSPVC